MANTSRHHHFIPQCYLRGFAGPGSGKHPQIVVSNIKHKTQFPTNPRNVGGSRDFNRISVEGRPPNEIEDAYAKFEGALGESLIRIKETGTFVGDDRLRVLNLIGLLAVRSPQMREHWRKNHELLANRVMELALFSEERWNHQVAQIPELRDAPDKVPYAKMKDFFERGEYTVDINQDYHIETELRMLDAILPHLVERKWTMWVSEDDAGAFITSDHPVLLEYKDPSQVAPLYRNHPGFGLANTIVVFPLSRRHALVGDFDGEECVRTAPAELVGGINTMVCTQAHEAFYSPSRTIQYQFIDLTTDARTVYRDSHIFKRLFGGKSV